MSYRDQLTVDNFSTEVNLSIRRCKNPLPEFNGIVHTAMTGRIWSLWRPIVIDDARTY
jgi:hypothetical protein